MLVPPSLKPLRDDAKLRYLMSRLRLASSVGNLGDDDIDQINNYLGPELLVTK